MRAAVSHHKTLEGNSVSSMGAASAAPMQTAQSWQCPGRVCASGMEGGCSAHMRAVTKQLSVDIRSASGMVVGSAVGMRGAPSLQVLAQGSVSLTVEASSAPQRAAVMPLSMGIQPASNMVEASAALTQTVVNLPRTQEEPSAPPTAGVSAALIQTATSWRSEVACALLMEAASAAPMRGVTS